MKDRSLRITEQTSCLQSVFTAGNICDEIASGSKLK